MQTTLGQLIADLYDAYEQRAHDPEIAALATAATLNDVLCEAARRGRASRAADGVRVFEHHASV